MVFGDILLCSEGSNATLVLQHVLFVPDATIRLISITCFTEDLVGSILFDNHQAILFNKEYHVIATGSCVPGRHL